MTISARSQLAALYLLVAIWHGIWIAAWFSGKAFLGGLHVTWSTLFFFIPILWLYGFVRLAWSERVFITDHPLAFLGSFAFALLPPVAVLAFVLLAIRHSYA